ncbi:MAG: 30S ribosomal protein S6 [Eubacteriales bacterium]
MVKYEGVFILKPNMEEEENKSQIERVKSIIEDNGGKIDNIDEWGQRRLAYEIKKNKEGYYTIINFQAETDLIKELDRTSKINENMIRHMIVRDEN